ncbi:hypothetical protein Taro_016992, partial [Colocasia esculenta]|nr:hypothetical protein [Colocasia esculenta]
LALYPLICNSLAFRYSASGRDKSLGILLTKRTVPLKDNTTSAPQLVFFSFLGKKLKLMFE